MGGIYTFVLSLIVEKDINAVFFLHILAVIGSNTLIGLFLRLIEAIENLETIEDDHGGTTNEQGVD